MKGIFASLRIRASLIDVLPLPPVSRIAMIPDVEEQFWRMSNTLSGVFWLSREEKLLSDLFELARFDFFYVQVRGLISADKTAEATSVHDIAKGAHAAHPMNVRDIATMIWLEQHAIIRRRNPGRKVRRVLNPSTCDLVTCMWKVLSPVSPWIVFQHSHLSSIRPDTRNNASYSSSNNPSLALRYSTAMIHWIAAVMVSDATFRAFIGNERNKQTRNQRTSRKANIKESDSTRAPQLSLFAQ